MEPLKFFEVDMTIVPTLLLSVSMVNLLIYSCRGSYESFTDAKDFKISTIVFVFISIAIIISSFSQGVKLSACVWKVSRRRKGKYPLSSQHSTLKRKNLGWVKSNVYIKLGKGKRGLLALRMEF